MIVNLKCFVVKCSSLSPQSCQCQRPGGGRGQLTRCLCSGVVMKVAPVDDRWLSASHLRVWPNTWGCGGLQWTDGRSPPPSTSLFLVTWWNCANTAICLFKARNANTIVHFVAHMEHTLAHYGGEWWGLQANWMNGYWEHEIRSLRKQLYWMKKNVYLSTSDLNGML